MAKRRQKTPETDGVILCRRCEQSGGLVTHRNLSKLSNDGWQLAVGRFSDNLCPGCAEEKMEAEFGELSKDITVTRLVGYDHYRVALTWNHADAAAVKWLIAAVRKFCDRKPPKERKE